MSSGKGSMQATGKQTSESQLPAYLQQPYNELTAKIGSTFNQPTPNLYGTSPLSQQYFQNAGQPISPMQGNIAHNVLTDTANNNFIGQQAQNVAQNAPNNVLGDLAQNVLGQGNNTLGNAASNYLQNAAPVQQWTDPGVAQNWMNPYTQNVLQAQTDMANRQYQQGQAGRNQQAIQAGAFGGDRQAIADATSQSQFNQQLQNMQQQGLQNAYQAGQQGFQGQQALNLQGAGLGGQLQALQNQYGLAIPQLAGTLQEQQNQYGLMAPQTAAQLMNMQNQYGLSGQQLAGQLYGQQGSLGLQGLSMLGGAANTQQQLQAQQGLLPYNMLSTESQLLQSMPGAQNQTTTDYTRSNPMGAIFGLLGNAAGAAMGGGFGTAMGKSLFGGKEGGLIGGKS